MWRDRTSSIAAAVALAVLGGSVARCGYPDFRYQDETEDGEGGEGAGGGGPVVSVASTSSGPGPQVPCGPTIQTSADCAVGEVCCYHLRDPKLDHCAAPMACGPGYTEFSCNTSADCPPLAAICCAKDNDLDNDIDVIGCQGNCASLTETPMCLSGAECASGQCAPVGYPGYLGCSP